MFLKAQLARKVKQQSLKELEREYSHRLPDLWDAVKKDLPRAALSMFDDTIAALHPFEDVRYPDKAIVGGAQLSIRWQRSSFVTGLQPGNGPIPPLYEVTVADIDNLVAAVLEACSVNPEFFTCSMNEYALDVLVQRNVASGWLLKSRLASRVAASASEVTPQPPARAS
jgi:hypothetical protein